MMMFVQDRFSHTSWLARVFAGALLAGVIATGASAADRNYVLRDGRKVPLVKSDNELGVVFRSHSEVEEARRRLEDAGHGLVQDIEGAPGARVKILRIAIVGGGDVLRDLVAADPAVEDVQPVYRFAGADSPVISTGKIVAKLRSGLTAAQRESLWEDFGIVDAEVFDGLHDVYIVKPVDGVDEVLLAEQLAGDDRTLWANPNFRRAARPSQVGASDEFFNLQWHLNNTGQTGGDEGADINATEAWLTATGQNVLFGMFDTACDVDHEDLRDNYIGVGQDIARPPFDDPRPKLPFAVEGHGTSVMGLAVAAGNSIGVRGVAFRSRFTASRGLSEFVPDVAIASTYTFAMAQGVDVHINSWAPAVPNFFPTPPVIEDAIETAFNEGRDLDGEGGDDPLGMVIVFGSGNRSTEIFPGFGPATMPQVIAIGASTDEDSRADFSNYGAHLNFLAPGEGRFPVEIVTTDNEDDRVSAGFNVGGFGFIGPDIDPNGKYTGQFGGTSASCPIAAGVAGLILSVNPKLTATDVRIIMEHSSDQVSPDDARYDGVTSKSFKYGYGRINAQRAVIAAQGTLTNGGFTWPDVPGDVRFDKSTLLWRAGVGTNEFIVVESVRDFDFAPQVNACFDGSQLGCSEAALSALPAGASVLFVGCGDEDENCEPGSEQSVDFQRPVVGTKLLAIYARNSSSRRYSFGARMEVLAALPPSVTINALPLQGRSPLTVRFNGNALSELEIVRTEWDFDVDDPSTPNQNTPAASFTYEVAQGETRTFTARLTVVDALGVEGSAEIRIHVSGGVSEEVGAALPTAGGDVRIVVGVPGTPGSNLSQGVSPFAVELRIESDTPASAQSILWDLGDGSRASGLIVPHTYINEGDVPRTFVVIASVTTMNVQGATVTTTTDRVITVLPGAQLVDFGEPDLPGTRPLGSGGAATACGAMGMIPMLLSTVALCWLRRRP